MQRPKSIHVLAALLFLSLAGNLFCASKMAGEHFARAEDRKARWERHEQKLKESLSAADFAIARESMTQGRAQFRAAREKLDEAHGAVGKAMDAKPFDRQALDAALKREAELKAEFLADMKASREETLQKLSPEGREIVDRMWQERKEHFRKRGDHPFGGGKREGYRGERE